jgi:hypothetical protein
MNTLRIDTAGIRQISRVLAAKMGFSTNPALPLLEAPTLTRSTDDILNRTLAMLATAIAAYGFPRKKALTWLERESSLDSLTPSERQFLDGAKLNPVPFTEQIEAMWALCWSLKLVPDLDFSKPCSNDFVTLFPSIKKDEPSTAFRQKAALRDPRDLTAKCDLACVLHNALTNSGLPTRLKSLDPIIIPQRRHALEWLLTSQPWEEITLDT